MLVSVYLSCLKSNEVVLVRSWSDCAGSIPGSSAYPFVAGWQWCWGLFWTCEPMNSLQLPTSVMMYDSYLPSK